MVDRSKENSLENHKFVEKVGQANFFHHRNWWKKLAWLTFSTISQFSPQPSTQVAEEVIHDDWRT